MGRIGGSKLRGSWMIFVSRVGWVYFYRILGWQAIVFFWVHVLH